MAEIGSAFVSLLPSARGFGRRLESEVGGETKGAAKKLGSGFGKMFAAAAGAFAVGDFLKGAVSGAADLEQSVGAINTVFKGSAKRMHDWAKGAAQDVGLTRNEFNELGTLIGTQLRNGGAAMDELAPKTNELIGLGADLSSMFGGTTREAVEALSSALKGERDPIERYGVSLTQAKIDAEAAALGFEKVGGALSSEASQAATLSLIMKQTSDAHGNFAEESDTLAGQQQRLAAQWANMKDSLGTRLLPVLTTFAEYINTTALPAISGLAGEARDVAGVAWGKLQAGVETLGDLSGISFDSIKDLAATSWGKLQGAIDALTRLTDLDFSKIDGRELGSQLGNALVDGLSGLGSMASMLTEKLGEMFDQVDWVGLGIALGKQAPALLIGLVTGILNFDMGSLLQGVGDHWFEILMGVLAIAFAPAKFIGPLTRMLTKIPFVGRFLAAAVKWVSDIGSRLTKFGGDLLRTFWRGFTQGSVPGAAFVTRVLGLLRSVPGRIKGFFATLQTRIGVWALDAFEAMGRSARRAVTAILRFVASIPGRILSALGSLARTLSPRGSELIAGFGRAISSAFGRVSSFVKGIPGRIRSALGNVGSLLVGAGEDLIRGMMGGIRNMAGSLVGAAKDVVGGAIDGAKKLLGIRSPSRVFKVIGAQTAEGFIVGLRRMAKAVKKAGGDIGKQAKAGIRKSLDNAQDFLKGLRDRMQEMASSVAQAFTPSSLFSTDSSGNAWAAGAGSALASFRSGLGAWKTDIAQASAAIRKLMKQGVRGDFLSQLAASGNTRLLTELAASGDARALQAEYNAATRATRTLADQAAGGRYGSDISRLERALDRLGDRLERASDRNARETGREINGAASRGHRERNRKGKR